MSLPPPQDQPPLWHPPGPGGAAPRPQPPVAHAGAGAAAAARPPLPDAERRRLLRLGAASGALLGVGTGLGGVVLLLWLIIGGISAVFAPLVIAYGQGDPLREALVEVVTPLTVALVAIGALLCLLALALGWWGLRRWGAGRALGVTAAAAAIASVPVHLANLAVALLALVLQPDVDESVGIALLAAVAACVGAVVGAAAGTAAWRWMGVALRPRR